MLAATAYDNIFGFVTFQLSTDIGTTLTMEPRHWWAGRQRAS
jgi:hypothetical protein